MITIQLSDPAHVLPLPGQPGRVLSGADTLTIDPENLFWAALLRDGSVRPVPKDTAKAGKAGNKETR